MAVLKERVAEGLDVFFAKPEDSGPNPAIILFTEGLGLNGDMLQGVVQRLADDGFFAAAPDIFHGDVFDGSDREAMMAKIRSIDDAVVEKETGQTVAWLRSRPEVHGDRIGGIGFCMGGRLAFLMHSLLGRDLRASACFYGGGIAPDRDGLGRAPVLDRVEGIQGPLLLGYGTDDASITPDEHARIVRALSEAKKRFEFHLFDNAGHAFMSESRPSYRPEASAQAWPIVLNFFGRNLRH